MKVAKEIRKQAIVAERAATQTANSFVADQMNPWHSPFEHKRTF